ncbi:GIY-YIG nuclease family protein [Sphingopyxis fribergensis]
MALTFNMLLRDGGIDPRDVRLLRHQQASRTGLTPYAIWRDDATELARYQSAQPIDRRHYFKGRYWASFVVPPDGSTLFVGLYEIGGHTSAPSHWIDPLHRQTAAQIGRDLDIYDYGRLPEFDAYAGCLKIEWGDGKRSWNQRAHQQDKLIVELTQSFNEPDFPGYTSFICALGALLNVPASWIAALSAVRGVYLLTCPRTREQYVGAAYGTSGFWGRWQSYIVTGHGGNEGLRSRDPSDYQISILEVAGSGAATNDIIAMEQRWKAKLQSREMGLNRN